MSCFGDGIQTIVGSLRVLGDLILHGSLFLVGASSKIVAENNTDTTGTIVSVISTPAAPSTAILMTLEADGLNWAAGSAVLKLVSDQANARVLRVFSGVTENLDINKNGTITTNGSIIMTSGGQIITSSNGDLVLLPNGTGIVIVGNAAASSHGLSTDGFLATGEVEIEDTLYLDGAEIVKETNEFVIQFEGPRNLADDASFDLPDATSGFATLIVGDAEEFTQFYWASDGTVTLVNPTANVVNTDTDTNFCVFDNGTTVRLRNRLGSAKTVTMSYKYSTP